MLLMMKTAALCVQILLKSVSMDEIVTSA